MQEGIQEVRHVLFLLRPSPVTVEAVNRDDLTIISGSSEGGMFPNAICLTATVSPVCQFSALL